MKVWKIISGILSIVFFFIVTIETGFEGLWGAFFHKDTTAVEAEFFCGILILIGGIVSLAVRNVKTYGGNTALIIIFGLCAIIGFANKAYGVFVNCPVWGLINAIVALFALLFSIKGPEEREEEEKSDSI